MDATRTRQHLRNTFEHLDSNRDRVALVCAKQGIGKTDTLQKLIGRNLFEADAFVPLIMIIEDDEDKWKIIEDADEDKWAHKYPGAHILIQSSAYSERLEWLSIPSHLPKVQFRIYIDDVFMLNGDEKAMFNKLVNEIENGDHENIIAIRGIGTFGVGDNNYNVKYNEYNEKLSSLHDFEFWKYTILYCTYRGVVINK